MTEARLIKKYENRRLYDTGESRYVNLEEVAKLVREGLDVQVVDAKTGEDLTRPVLTQIIVESSRGSQDGPPLEFLRDLIKSTDRAQKDFLQWYLGTASENYQKFRETWKSQSTWPSMDEQREAWAKMFDPFGAMRSVMKAAKGGGAQPEEERDEPPGEPEPSPPAADEGRAADEGSAKDEIAEMKKRLEDLETRLSDS